MISFGNITAKAVYFGSLAIKAVYAGAVKVWEKVAGLKNYIIKGNASVVDGKVKGVGDEFEFNQLAENGDFSNGLTGWNISRMSATIGQDSVDFAVSEVNDGCRIEQLNKTLQANHKYLVAFTAKPSHAGTLRLIINGSSGNFTDTLQPNVWSACALIVTSAQESNYFQLMPRCQSNGYAIGDIFSLRKNFTFFDLTAMGIADRVNSLADFKAYLVERGMMQSVDDELPYFAYDAGSVKTSMPIVVRSANLWDEEWEVGNISTTDGTNITETERIRSTNYIPVRPNTQYYFGCGNPSSAAANRIIYYDANKNFISGNAGLTANQAFTTPSQAYYMRFSLRNYGNVYLHDTIVAEGSTSVGYVPYYRKTYPCLISSPLFKVGNVVDAAESKTQKITRGFGRVKAKDLSWYDHLGFGMLLFYAEISNKAANTNYLFASFPIGSWPPADGRSFSDGTRMWVRDSSYADAASFKAHFSDDDYIIYELATPIEESAVLPAITEWQDGYILTTDTEIAPSEVVTEV